MRFCHFWQMNPRQVEQLSAAEWNAMVDYANKVVRAEQRAARKKGR